MLVRRRGGFGSGGHERIVPSVYLHKVQKSAGGAFQLSKKPTMELQRRNTSAKSSRRSGYGRLPSKVRATSTGQDGAAGELE